MESKKEKKVEKKITDSQRIDRLESVLAKMAHFSGNEAILTEFGIPKWAPGKKDMSRWAS